jgi:hypothetical protein
MFPVPLEPPPRQPTAQDMSVGQQAELGRERGPIVPTSGDIRSGYANLA